MTLDRETEKRSDFRSPISYPVWYRELGEKGLEGDWERTVTRDLSGGGMSIELAGDHTLARHMGGLLELQVVIPPSPVFALGKIVRVFHDEGGRLCVGVMFASITPADQDRIVRFVLNEGLERP